MKCPPCKETDLLMSERMGVEIDYCPQCRCIWLDRGELDKVEQSADGPRTVSRLEDRRYYDDHQHKGHHGHGAYHSRRRPWLGNLLHID
ncbi:MAG: zf-TFIIB domain-containing protein [Gallionellaceae bacterium]|nr:zf-TFIIB domain-containing protein [Gallionellaceae bacterium]